MTDTPIGPVRRSRRVRVGLAVAALVVFGTLLALGTWQVRRLSWKRDLIARVEARVSQTPQAAPGPSAWSGLSAEADAYRSVTVSGVFLNDRETTVQAVTDLGGGYWVLTPFRADGGFTVLINRGFVPPDRRDPSSRRAGQIDGETRVTGLLRITEPGGAFLRTNDPSAERWYSRDVAAITKARAIAAPAPYFIDADAASNPGGFPVGGLTVIAFPNNHLVYALTWYALAALLAGACIWVIRDERRSGASGRSA